MRALLLAFIIALIACQTQAQTICVLESSGVVTAVVPNCPTGSVSVSTSNSAYQTYVTNYNNGVLLPQQYASQYEVQLQKGFILTSSSLGASSVTFQLNDNIINNILPGEYSSVVGTGIAQCSISNGSGSAGTQLACSSPASGAISVGNYVSGTGVTAGTQITSGSASPWTVNNSQHVATEWMMFGGLGTGFPSGSTLPIADVTNTIWNFNPVQFLNYRNALSAYLLAIDEQGWIANGETFTGISNAATIP